MNDFENMRRVSADAAGVTPGIKWVVKMNGKLTHIKRRAGNVEGTSMRKAVGTALNNKQEKIARGTACFADHMAGGKSSREERILQETTKNLRNRLHPGKTQNLGNPRGKASNRCKKEWRGGYHTACRSMEKLGIIGKNAGAKLARA